MARLRVTQGSNVGDVYELGDEAILGRVPEVEVQIHDNKASRKHTKVSRTGDSWTVEDLESRNGTGVNGKKIVRVELRDGDVIRIGKTELTFEDPDAPAPPMPAQDISAETETLQRPISSAVRRDALVVAPKIVEKRFDPAVFSRRPTHAGLWDDLDEKPGSYRAMVIGGVGLAAAVVGVLSFFLTMMAIG